MGYVGDAAAIGGALHQVMKSRNVYKRTAQLGAGLAIGNISRKDMENNGLNAVNGIGMAAGFGSAAMGLKGIYNRFSANAAKAEMSPGMYMASKLSDKALGLHNFSHSLSEEPIRNTIQKGAEQASTFGHRLFQELSQHAEQVEKVAPKV